MGTFAEKSIMQQQQGLYGLREEIARYERVVLGPLLKNLSLDLVDWDALYANAEKTRYGTKAKRIIRREVRKWLRGLEFEIVKTPPFSDVVDAMAYSLAQGRVFW